MTSQVRNLVEIAEDMNNLNLKVFQRRKPSFTIEETHIYQKYLLEVGNRFKQILDIIQIHAKETLQDVSLGMEEIDDDKHADEVMWSAIEFMTNNHDTYFNTKLCDKFDIADMAHLFHDKNVPQEVENSFIEMITFSDQIGVPHGNSKVIANKDGVFVEYTPDITEHVSMNISA